MLVHFSLLRPKEGPKSQVHTGPSAYFATALLRNYNAGRFEHFAAHAIGTKSNQFSLQKLIKASKAQKYSLQRSLVTQSRTNYQCAWHLTAAFQATGSQAHRVTRRPLIIPESPTMIIYMSTYANLHSASVVDSCCLGYTRPGMLILNKRAISGQLPIHVHRDEQSVTTHHPAQDVQTCHVFQAYCDCQSKRAIERSNDAQAYPVKGESLRNSTTEQAHLQHLARCQHHHVQADLCKATDLQKALRHYSNRRFRGRSRRIVRDFIAAGA
eukprot:6209911-Pleurochrysis_carterae.AAC.2